MFNFVKENELANNLLKFLSVFLVTSASKSLIVYTKSKESENYHLHACGPIVRKFVIEVGELITLRDKLLSVIVDSSLSLTDIEKIHLSQTVSSCFALNRFNCSSFASYDLFELMTLSVDLQKRSLINYSYPKYKEKSNNVTLILKERKTLKRERILMYPSSLVQELVR